MVPKPTNAAQVSPVPARISLRGLKRGTSTGPIQSVSSAASGKPNVICPLVQWNSRWK